MKMMSLCEASSRRTGSGEWQKWTAPSSEGVCGPGLAPGQCLGSAQDVTGLLTFPATDCHSCCSLTL